MPGAERSSLRRLIALGTALLGVMVTTLPSLFPLPSPAPLILIGCGVTVVALGSFLFVAP